MCLQVTLQNYVCGYEYASDGWCRGKRIIKMQMINLIDLYR